MQVIVGYFVSFVVSVQPVQHSHSLTHYSLILSVLSNNLRDETTKKSERQKKKKNASVTRGSRIEKAKPSEHKNKEKEKGNEEES